MQILGPEGSILENFMEIFEKIVLQNSIKINFGNNLIFILIFPDTPRKDRPGLDRGPDHLSTPATWAGALELLTPATGAGILLVEFRFQNFVLWLEFQLQDFPVQRA